MNAARSAARSYLDALRLAELEDLLARNGDAFRDREVLEIGSGTGVQLAALRRVCRRAVGVDLATSEYAVGRDARIIEYDGRTLPFPDDSFDTVYSSNVLEHVTDQPTMQREIARVLRPDGVCLHLLPSQHWRLWTSLAHYPALPKLTWRRLVPRNGGALASGSGGALGLLGKVLASPPHGETGNRFTEYLYFRPAHWRRVFQAAGWQVVAIEPGGLFYTGQSLLGSRLSLATRRRLAGWLGSACHLYVLDRASTP
jgi:ubiquinone/menaquinone biosynthesis C-methylase UbiE